MNLAPITNTLSTLETPQQAAMAGTAAFSGGLLSASGGKGTNYPTGSHNLLWYLENGSLLLAGLALIGLGFAGMEFMK